MFEVSKLVSRLVEASGTAFCLVDPQVRSSTRALRNVDAEADEAYFLDHLSKDPLAPSRFEDRSDIVVSTDFEVSQDDLLASSFYTEFMAPRNYRHITDLFFRQNSRIIAVLSIIRTANMQPFSREEIELLKTVQPFIEYTLNKIFIAGRTSTREQLAARFGLTPREIDVVEWLLAGAKNKEIATELGVTLPTVKTHLLHIFSKVKVRSRTELLAVVHSAAPVQ